MRSLYAMLGSLVTVVASYLVALILLDNFYFSTSTPQDSFALSFLVYSIGMIAFPILTILVSIFYFKYDEMINVRGIAVGGVFGVWLYMLLDEHITIFVPYSSFIQKLLSLLPLLFIIVGYKVITRKLADNKVKYVLLGTVIGFIVSYVTVIGMRAAQNSLTSYFYFDTFEISIVLGAIAVSGVLGWFLARENKTKTNEV
ncbi:hypothetical protein NQ117_01470 [Paenibacillus sp. SC116]|uniref:hypothetical protein n=1 Tax=Paenibacillus sp. SC116 TaxID=2968986 RepID=UPI00215ADADD|nr:hypothetical protein [Paenibacillus sp. SC116]MCR8842344.1 hypothetical protein [Paenibacillus sp. SC116]